MELVVLGLDPGSNVTGFGVVAERSGQLRLVEAGVIRVGGDDLAGRLARIHARVAEVIVAHGVVEVAMENVFVGKNPASAIKLGQARGAAMAAVGARGLALSSYPPTTVKQAVVGTGRAEKTQVAFMVSQVLGCPKELSSLPADATDALAVAVCHLNQRRLARLSGSLGPA